MSSSTIDLELEARATKVAVTDQTITVELEDGRTISVPTAWYPRLRHATGRERKDFQISALGVEWPSVEADLSIRGLLLGRKSGESAESFNFWLENRKKGKQVAFVDYLRHRRQAKRGEAA